jgi:hypothetical protein
MTEYKIHTIKILKQLDEGGFKRGTNNLNLAYEAVLGFILGSFDLPDRNKNTGTFNKYIFDYCASKTYTDKLASNEYQEKVEQRSRLQAELSRQGNLEEYERKMRSQEIDKNVPMFQELLGFAKGLFSVETSAAADLNNLSKTRHDEIRKNPYKGKQYERIENKFDAILKIWTNDLKGKLDGKVEHEAEVPNVPVEVDEDRAWDYNEEDEKGSQEHKQEMLRGKKQNKIKKTLRLIESLRTTPILTIDIETFDKTNFTIIANMIKSLQM